MTVGRCYLTPSPRQQLLIEHSLAPGDTLILTNDILRSGTSGLRDALVKLEEVEAAGLDVLCMTETSVYLASLAEGRLNVGFSQEMLKATTKLKKQAIMESVGLPVIPTVPFSLRAGGGLPADPPFIVKPDFGFGSQLAMRIGDRHDWQRFLKAAANPDLWKSRQAYANLLFADDEGLLDRFVIQPDLSWSTFLTVSFVFVDGVARTFIAAGERVEAGLATSFAWRGFSAPVSLPCDTVAEIDGELGYMADAIGCRNGVYAAELLWSDSEHWYLEFEPRPQSGLIPDLLLYAFGVDVDELMIRLFRDDAVVLPDVGRALSPTHFGLRRDGSQGSMDHGRLVTAIDRDSAGSMLRDEIWALPKGDD